MSKTFHLSFLVLILALGACQSPVASTSKVSQSSGMENMHVVIVTPTEKFIDTESFPLPNCGGTSELRQTLGMQASIKKTVTIGVKATIKGGGEVIVSETAKLQLALEVEAAYQKTYESVNSRLGVM